MQKNVEKFLKEYSLGTSVEARFIDLVSEVGELGKEILKGNDYGKTPHKNSLKLKDEMGDCLFSLLALCCESGIDAEEALQGALEKYKKRFSDKGDIGSLEEVK